jgi:hypothetical protein
MATKMGRLLRLLRGPNIDLSIAYSGDQRIKELPEIVEILKLWTYKARVLRILQIFLGVAAIFFSLLTAALIDNTGGTGDTATGFNAVAKWTAFVAALAVALMTGFDLGTKANNVMRAWRKLYVGIINFNKGLVDKEAVIKTYEEAESIIGDVTFQGSSSV